jgi:DNA helicase-2/ATP-dependent DNA helicase PcrA
MSPLAPLAPPEGLVNEAVPADARPLEGRAGAPAVTRAADVLAGLNPPQQEVATRPAGPLLVVAGPGAGKTRAIVARVAHLIQVRRVPPSEITAITFSRRAAEELRARLSAMLGGAAARAGWNEWNEGEAVWSGTFHALGARILRRGGALLFGRPLNFTIYDQDDTERALRRLLVASGTVPGQAGRLTTRLRQAISLAKRRGLAPTAADNVQLVAGVPPLHRVERGPGGEVPPPSGASWPSGIDREAFLDGFALDPEPDVPVWDVFRGYEDELRDAAAFDFDDLVAAATFALERDGALRTEMRRRVRHLLVDEYQDTDPAQERFLSRLSTPPHDVCVVADPQQSIYAFRGAAPEQVQQFVERWPNAGIIRLEQNYRSTKSIVAVARRLNAAQAPTAAARAFLGLRLWTTNPGGEPARLWVAPHPEKEADAIARDVAGRLERGWAPEEIAVLVRTHAQARPIEAALLRARVPYVLVGGVRFYGREEIKDALAYLRLAALPEDAAAFWRVVNTPRRGLGPVAVLAIARETLDGGGPIAGARRWAATEAAPDGLYDLLAHLDELAGIERTGAGPRRVLETALRLTGYQDYLRRQHPDDVQVRLEGLAELLRIASTYTDTRQFLDDTVLAGEEDQPAPTEGRVRLSTVHAAKGLEFRAVYVPGCELGLFPLVAGKPSGAGNDPARESEVGVAGAGSGLGADTPAEARDSAAGPTDEAFGVLAGGDEEPNRERRTPAAVIDPEERRIFYVAVTRAKESLTLSYCTFRRDARVQPSPYLAEIGRGLLRRAKLGTDEPAPIKPRRPAGRPGA